MILKLPRHDPLGKCFLCRQVVPQSIIIFILQRISQGFLFYRLFTYLGYWCLDETARKNVVRVVRENVQNEGAEDVHDDAPAEGHGPDRFGDLGQQVVEVVHARHGRLGEEHCTHPVC